MIVYIHGASATAESFTHIRQFVRDTFEEEDIALEYNSADGFDHNLKHMKGQLDDADRLFFISHSLGGIYAVSVSAPLMVEAGKQTLPNTFYLSTS